MAWAVTGPTSGSASNSSAVALLRFTKAPRPAAPAPAAPAADDPETVSGGRGAPTTICSPSTSTRARLRPDRSAPGRGPPAAAIASTTREPAGRSSTPGWRTFPVTSTVTVVVDAAPTAVPAVAG